MANTYIEYAKGGTDYRAKGTISCWVKRSELGREQYVWGWGENNSSDCYLRFDTADNIEINADGAGTNYNSTALFRDTNAWYHFVFSIDGQNSTANLRRRFWINGVQQDEGQGSVSAFSGAVFGWHSVQDLWIGANPRQQQASGHAYFNGLISHFHYCSNYSYTASDFGETDATTGEWKIKTDPNVQYGSEGFFLKMENGSNMDLDSSGNNKTLTTSGTLTKTEDCPSNVFATINPLDNYYPNSSFANGNTYVATAGSKRSYNTGTIGASSGKYYWEVKCVSNVTASNGCWIGIASTNPTNDGSSSQQTLGYKQYDYGFASSTGNTMTNNTQTSYGNAYGDNDIIGVAMDLDNNKLYFSKNGTWENSGVPTSGSTGTGAISIQDPSGTVNGVYTPGLGDWWINGFNVAFNFGNGYFGTTAVSSAGTNASGNGIFEYDVPNGFTALSTKGLNL